MTAARVTAVLLALLALALPGSAPAQTTTAPGAQGTPPLTSTPRSTTEPRSPAVAQATQAAQSLPATGSEPLLILLAGASLLLIGTGLRLSAGRD